MYNACQEYVRELYTGIEKLVHCKNWKTNDTKYCCHCDATVNTLEELESLGTLLCKFPILRRRGARMVRQMEANRLIDYFILLVMHQVSEMDIFMDLLLEYNDLSIVDDTNQLVSSRPGGDDQLVSSIPGRDDLVIRRLVESSVVNVVSKLYLYLWILERGLDVDNVDRVMLEVLGNMEKEIVGRLKEKHGRWIGGMRRIVVHAKEGTAKFHVNEMLQAWYGDEGDGTLELVWEEGEIYVKDDVRLFFRYDAAAETQMGAEKLRLACRVEDGSSVVGILHHLYQCGLDTSRLFYVKAIVSCTDIPFHVKQVVTDEMAKYFLRLVLKWGQEDQQVMVMDIWEIGLGRMNRDLWQQMDIVMQTMDVESSENWMMEFWIVLCMKCCKACDGEKDYVEKVWNVLQKMQTRSIHDFKFCAYTMLNRIACYIIAGGWPMEVDPWAVWVMALCISFEGKGIDEYQLAELCTSNQALLVVYFLVEHFVSHVGIDVMLSVGILEKQLLEQTIYNTRQKLQQAIQTILEKNVMMAQRYVNDIAKSYPKRMLSVFCRQFKIKEPGSSNGIKVNHSSVKLSLKPSVPLVYHPNAILSGFLEAVQVNHCKNQSRTITMIFSNDHSGSLFIEMEQALIDFQSNYSTKFTIQGNSQHRVAIIWNYMAMIPKKGQHLMRKSQPFTKEILDVLEQIRTQKVVDTATAAFQYEVRIRHFLATSMPPNLLQFTDALIYTAYNGMHDENRKIVANLIKSTADWIISDRVTSATRFLLLSTIDCPESCRPRLLNFFYFSLLLSKYIQWNEIFDEKLLYYIKQSAIHGPAIKNEQTSTQIMYGALHHLLHSEYKNEVANSLALAQSLNFAARCPGHSEGMRLRWASIYNFTWDKNFDPRKLKLDVDLSKDTKNSIVYILQRQIKKSSIHVYSGSVDAKTGSMKTLDRDIIELSEENARYVERYFQWCDSTWSIVPEFIFWWTLILKEVNFTNNIGQWKSYISQELIGFYFCIQYQQDCVAFLRDWLKLTIAVLVNRNLFENMALLLSPINMVCAKFKVLESNNSSQWFFDSIQAALSENKLTDHDAGFMLCRILEHVPYLYPICSYKIVSKAILEIPTIRHHAILHYSFMSILLHHLSTQNAIVSIEKTLKKLQADFCSIVEEHPSLGECLEISSKEFVHRILEYASERLPGSVLQLYLPKISHMLQNIFQSKLKIPEKPSKASFLLFEDCPVFKPK